MSRHQSVYHVYEITTDDEDIDTPEPPPVYVNEPENPEDIGFWRGRRTNTDVPDVDNPQQLPANEYYGGESTRQAHQHRYVPDEQIDSTAVGKSHHVIDLEKAKWNNPLRRGVMIALFPTPGEAEQILDLTKAVSTETPENLHLTLVFLGKIGEDLFEGDEMRLLEAVKGFAKVAPAVIGRVSGIGKFTAQDEEDAKDVIHLTYDSPVLPDFRHTLTKYLEASGVSYKEEHGFDPHMTLAYTDAGKSVRLPHVPLYAMDFMSIVLAIGGDRYEFELEGSKDNLVKSESPQLSWGNTKSKKVSVEGKKSPHFTHGARTSTPHGTYRVSSEPSRKAASPAKAYHVHYTPKSSTEKQHVGTVKQQPEHQTGYVEKHIDDAKRMAEAHHNKQGAVSKAIFTKEKDDSAKKAPDPQKNDSKKTDMRGRVRYGYSASSGARNSTPNGNSSNGEEAPEPALPGDNLAETLGKITRTSSEEVKRLARRFEDSDRFARHFMSRHGKLCKKHGIRNHHLHHIHDASARKSHIPLVVADKSRTVDGLMLIDIEKADVNEYEPDLADESNIIDFDDVEVELGIKFELKHTEDAQEARRRVISRLQNNPKYYSNMDRPAGQGEQIGAGNTMADQNVPVVKSLSSWPKHVRDIGRKLEKKYGPPDMVSDAQAVWYGTAPFKRTVLSRKGTPHKFPGPHKDYLEQVIDYDVPVEKAGDVIKFDGSVHIYRTMGELGARCDFQGANYLALNLAVDVAEGRKSVKKARKAYAEAIQMHTDGDDPPEMKKLLFKPQRNTGDPDKKTM